MSADKKHIYFLGIIDTLTDYDSIKKLEYMIKYIAFGPTISSIPPKQYAERFYNFMENLIEIH